MTRTPSADLQHAAEVLALQLTRGGLQRMTARVLASLLFSNDDTITAGEISRQLAASPGTISTTIRTLERSGLVERVPVPGSRRQHFRFPADGWVRLMSSQNETLTHLADAAHDGLRAVSVDSYAGRRLTDMAGFYAYLTTELPNLLEQWRAASPSPTSPRRVEQ